MPLNIQTLRKERGMTQEALAAKLGVSAQAVSKWENGSYPDGDLLPKIADLFGVSIDYLFGRAEREVSVQQQIVDKVASLINLDTIENAGDVWELFYELAWAFQIGCCPGERQWYWKPTFEATSALASASANNKGFSFLSLDKNWPFVFMTADPPDGYSEVIKADDKTCELFKFLSDKNNLRVLFYLNSTGDGRLQTLVNISKNLNISKDKVQSALDYLKKLFDWMMKASVIEDVDGKQLSAYEMPSVCFMLMASIFAGAKTVLNLPTSWRMQVGTRSTPYFDKEKIIGGENHEKEK